MLHGYTDKDTRKPPLKQKIYSIETSSCCHEKVKKGYVVLETIKEKIII